MLPISIGVGDGLDAAVLAQLPGGDQAIELPDRRFHIVGINLELGDALVALEADGGDAVLHREPSASTPTSGRSAGPKRRPSAASGNS